MLKLGPGWLCHPNDPPGARRLSTTLTSESPLVRRSSFQAPVLMLTSVAGRLPAAIGVFVTPTPAVASATPAATAEPARATTRAATSRLDVDFIGSPVD